MKFKEYTQIKEIVNTVAIWISPKGELVADFNSNHIKMVISNPQKFGLTMEYIEDKHEKYNEPVGIEGKAREEIIRELVKKGWIRIRRYPNKFWSVTVQKMNKKVKDFLYDWSQKVLSGVAGFKEKDKFMPVNIVLLGGGKVDKFITVQDVANDALFEGIEKFDYDNVLLEKKSVDDFS